MDSSRETWSALEECGRHKKAYLIVILLAVVLALVVAGSIPKEYAAEVKVSDERQETDLLLGLNNMAAWAKSALGDEQEGVRLPEVYNRLITTRAFAESMSHVRIEGYGTDYHHYLLDHHRRPWWGPLTDLFRTPESDTDKVMDIIQDNIRSKVSTKYNTIQLQVVDQDPVVAAMLADSVRVKLQHLLEKYLRQRTLRDVVISRQKTAVAKERFDRVRNDYITFADSHQDITSVKVQQMEDHLMKEYENAFKSYNAALEQQRRAEAIAGRTPTTFVTLSNATVPLKPSAPATTGFVLSFLLIGLTVTTWVVLGRRKYQIYKQALWRS